MTRPRGVAVADQLALDIPGAEPDEKPLPPLPPPGDLTALQAYLERYVPRGGSHRRRDDTMPPLHIPMPPPLAPGELSDVERKGIWTALMKSAHWIDGWPRADHQPRYYAAVLRYLAYDVLFARDRHFPPARTLSPRARREMEARDG